MSARDRTRTTENPDRRTISVPRSVPAVVDLSNLSDTLNKLEHTAACGVARDHPGDQELWDRFLEEIEELGS